MLSTNNNLSTKNIDISVNNSALDNLQTKTHSVRSNENQSKSTSNVSDAHKHSSKQSISFPEADHEKKQINSNKKEADNKKTMIDIENKKIQEKNKFQKIQPSESSDDITGYSRNSETESYPNAREIDLLQRKKEIANKINSLSKKQSEIKNKGGREYENQERDLENLKKELKSINESLSANESDGTISDESEKSISENGHKKIDNFYKTYDFLLKANQLIENEITSIEENKGISKIKNPDLEQLKNYRDTLFKLAIGHSKIFSDKNINDSERSSDKISKIKRTSTPPRSADAERRTAREKLLRESSGQDLVYPEEKMEASDDSASYYDELCSKFSFCLEKISDINDKINKNLSNKKKQDAEILLQKQYRILSNLAKELQAFLPDQTENLSPENASQYSTTLLEKIKSDRTRELEHQYHEALNEYKRELDTYSCTWLKSIAGKFFAGPLAFAVSFGTGNTLNRLVPPEHQRWISYSIAPLWSASFHALFAGPIAKQCLSRMWTSPILGEMNNYFRLLGSYAADRYKGESGEKKYNSKDPAKTEKLTIGERWAEERSVNQINFERMKTEEAGFAGYSINYILKGIAPAFFPEVYSSKELSTRGNDAAAHFVAGAVSSAENVYAQQYLRSRDPKAKELTLPTQAISGMEAAHLRSLAIDLATAIDSDEYKDDHKARHTLVRLLRQTNKAAVIAERKSTCLGTLKQELMDSLKDAPSRLDMTSEIIGRFISLMFVAGMSQVTAEFRKSTNPGLRFLGHVIPAIDLIAPPGWAFRGLYAGYIRALLQFFYELKKPDDKQPDLVTRIPKSVQNPMDGGTQSTSKADEIHNEVSNDADNDADDDSSIFVSMTDDSDDSDDWDGNPLSRDERGM